MTTTTPLLAVPLATVDLRNGALVGIWANSAPEGVFDSCDCHRLVWPAPVLAYQPGPDTYECPLAVD